MSTLINIGDDPVVQYVPIVPIFSINELAFSRAAKDVHAKAAAAKFAMVSAIAYASSAQPQKGINGNTIAMAAEATAAAVANPAKIPTAILVEYRSSSSFARSEFKS